VQYTGPVNDLLLRIDPQTGEAAMANISTFLTPPEVKGFSLLSNSGSLVPGMWNSFSDSGEAGAGWDEANPRDVAISELNLESFFAFDYGTVISMGNIFDTAGTRDVVFEWVNSLGEVRLGTVEYGEIPVIEPTPPADFNGDGEVNLIDFNTLKDNFGLMPATKAQGDANGDGNIDLVDFNILKDSFGQGGSASVPEPSSLLLAALGLLAIPAARRSWRARR
jgi:hypothetical protein